MQNLTDNQQVTITEAVSAGSLNQKEQRIVTCLCLILFPMIYFLGKLLVTFFSLW